MRQLLLYLVILAALCACAPSLSGGRSRSDAGPAMPPPSGDAATLPPPDDASAPLVDPFADVDRTPDPACRDTWIVGVMGRVTTEDGAALEGAYVQACIALADDFRACLRPGVTGADGRYAVTFPEANRCAHDVVLRVLVPEADMTTAYCRLALTAPRAVLDAGGDIVLHRTERPSALPPLGDASRARTVTFANGLSIDVTPDAIGEEAYAAFSARILDGAELARVCPGDEGGSFDAVLTFAPEASVRAPSGLPFRLPMSAPAGSRHELYVLGGIGTSLPDGTTVPEAEWQRFGVATASGDGVVASAAPGLVHLSWVGVRPAP